MSEFAATLLALALTAQLQASSAQPVSPSWVAEPDATEIAVLLGSDHAPFGKAYVRCDAGAAGKLSNCQVYGRFGVNYDAQVLKLTDRLVLGVADSHEGGVYFGISFGGAGIEIDDRRTPLLPPPNPPPPHLVYEDRRETAP